MSSVAHGSRPETVVEQVAAILPNHTKYVITAIKLVSIECITRLAPVKKIVIPLLFRTLLL
jgi:hypothetical protein